jgi:hypothetical protein
VKCTECGKPVRAKGLCSTHYQRERVAKIRQGRKRLDKTLYDERRDFLNAFKGAQNALKRLSRQNTEIDYSSALQACEERIEALSQVSP